MKKETTYCDICERPIPKLYVLSHGGMTLEVNSKIEKELNHICPSCKNSIREHLTSLAPKTKSFGLGYYFKEYSTRCECEVYFLRDSSGMQKLRG